MKVAVSPMAGLELCLKLSLLPRPSHVCGSHSYNVCLRSRIKHRLSAKDESITEVTHMAAHVSVLHKDSTHSSRMLNLLSCKLQQLQMIVDGSQALLINASELPTEPAQRHRLPAVLQHRSCSTGLTISQASIELLHVELIHRQHHARRQSLDAGARCAVLLAHA